jgi:hypothetical protein
MATGTIQDAIQREIDKTATNEDFFGFSLNKDNSKVIEGQKSDEYRFFVPMIYKGNWVYYVPKSYVDRGYYNPERNAWYGSPILLNKQVQDYLKPAKISDDIANKFKEEYTRGSAWHTASGDLVYKSVPQLNNVPDLQNGYIIDYDTLNNFKNQI